MMNWQTTKYSLLLTAVITLCPNQSDAQCFGPCISYCWFDGSCQDGSCTCASGGGDDDNDDFFETIFSAPFEIIDAAIGFGIDMIDDIFTDFENCASGLFNPTCDQLTTATSCMQVALNAFPAAKASSRFVRLSSTAKSNINRGVQAAGSTLDAVEQLCTQHGCSYSCSHPLGDDSSTSSCDDTFHSAVDSAGDDCSWYAWNSDECGEYDTGSFVANDLCCSCGGGSASTGGGLHVFPSSFVITILALASWLAVCT